MRLLLRWMGWFLAALMASCAMGVLAFDVMVVRPVVARIEGQLRAAAPSERQPSAVLIGMLHRAHGARINHLAGDEALWASPSMVEGMGTLHQLLTRVGVALLLPLHLSDAEIAGAYLATAYMGLKDRGYAAASRSYLGVELDRIDLAQAARLVAIAQSPRSYADNPERLERKTQQLLSRAASSN